MIEFAPNSPWPRRIKRGFIAVPIVLVLLKLTGWVSQHWIESAGGSGVVITQSRIKSLSVMLKARSWVKSGYPTQAAGLESLFKKSRMGSAQMRGEDPMLDFWKRKIQYRFPGVHNKDSFDLWSYGEDGEDGTDDDITNW